MEMVWIQPGTFVMGSPTSESGHIFDEAPQHEVTISQGFYLGKYEITQAQWEAVTDMRPWSAKTFVREGPNYPAAYISWDAAQAFVGIANAAAGDSLYRLPTEAEWELDARAGTVTTWPFGDDESQLTDFAWYKLNACDVGECYAHEVGTKQATAGGLFDMHGNVFEWVQDRYSSFYYTSSASVNPQGSRTERTPYVCFVVATFLLTPARHARQTGRPAHLPGPLLISAYVC